MISFLMALQFLTTLPVKLKEFDGKMMAWSLAYFPVVGLFLGLMLFGLNTLLITLGLSGLGINIILVIALIISTGGLHLDGLADTADALLSGQPKEKMLEIMRDPHVGVMGVLSLVSVILLKIGLLSFFGAALKPQALLLMCILSRWAPVMAMYLFPYARQEGKAKFFIQGLNMKIFILSLFTALIFSFIAWGFNGVLVLVFVAAWVYLMNRAVAAKLKGITGDTLGAGIELTEIIILLAVLTLGNI